MGGLKIRGRRQRTSKSNSRLVLRAKVQTLERSIKKIISDKRGTSDERSVLLASKRKQLYALKAKESSNVSYRKFGNKRFKTSDGAFYTSKAEANNFADFLRKYPQRRSRVVKTKGGYHVYVDVRSERIKRRKP